jgi:hypothetical protein
MYYIHVNIVSNHSTFGGWGNLGKIFRCWRILPRLGAHDDECYFTLGGRYDVLNLYHIHVSVQCIIYIILYI